MTAKARHRPKQASTPQTFSNGYSAQSSLSPPAAVINSTEMQNGHSSRRGYSSAETSPAKLRQQFERSLSIEEEAAERSRESSLRSQPSEDSLYSRWIHELSTNAELHDEILRGKRIALYRIKTTIGSGNFSTVKLAVHSLTKAEVAIKTLDKTKLDAKTQALLSREVANMERLHHPNVVRLYELQESLTKIHIVMEYAPKGDLHNRITSGGRMTEPYCKLIFAQLVAAIDHLHHRRVIHRDLKAENVFFASNSLVKLGDFGFSTVATADKHLTTFCGSPPYAAPELFRDDYYRGPGVDVWALGILLYFMATGVMPFRADTVSRLKRLILAGEFLMPPFLSTDCQKLLRAILVTAPDIRIPLAGLTHSVWLREETFPDPHPPFQLDIRLAGQKLPPSSATRAAEGDSNSKTTAKKQQRPDQSSQTETELVALREMRKLGINSDLIQSTNDESARGHLTGTYRIILHRLQKENSDEDSLLSGSRLSVDFDSVSAPNLRHTGHVISAPSTRSYGLTNGAVMRTQSLTQPPRQKESKMCHIL